MSLLDLIKQNKRLKRIKQALLNAGKDFDSKALTAELMRIQEKRLSRRLRPTDVIRSFQNKFLRAQLQNQSDRSRVTEIKLQCFNRHSDIESVLTKLRRYLSAEYNAQLQRAASTKGERDKLIESLLGDIIENQNKLMTVIKMCDMLIADIDATGWALTHMLKIVELAQPKTKEV